MSASEKNESSNDLPLSFQNETLEEVLDRIGVEIRSARKAMGLTQKELADTIKSEASYISKVENGLRDVHVSTLLKIIEGLNSELIIHIKAPISPS